MKIAKRIAVISILSSILLLNFLPSSAFAADAPAKADTLKLATEGAFRPFNFMEGSKLTGFEVELGDAIAKKLGMKSEWTVQAFDTLLISLNEHRFDVVAASHGITPERAKAVDFISPHYCSGAILVAKKGGPLDVKSLSGKVAGVTVGTTYFEQLKKLGSLKEIKTYPKDSDALLNLISGRIDVWVSDRFSAIEALRLVKNDDLKTGEIMFTETIAMAVAKGNTELKKRVDQALKEVMKDGTYASLSKKYFNEDIRCKK